VLLGSVLKEGKECPDAVEAQVSLAGRWGAGSDREARGEAEAAYSWFYRGEYGNVARTVFLIVHDRLHAEDITQDAFVALYVHWGRVRRYDRPDAWVRRVAIRMAVRYLRREGSRRVVESQAPIPSAASTVDLDVLRAIAKLPPTQRAAVVLYYFEDRPITEIAETIGLSTGAVKMALARSRRTLAQLLAEEADADVSRP
jgi:RNA polymerase sigma factor (sigma-70 family)